MEDNIFNNEELLLRFSFDSTDQFIAILDNQMIIKKVNKALKDLVGCGDDYDFQDIPYWELPVWGDDPELQNQIMFSLELIFHGDDVKFEARYPDNEGIIKIIEFTIKPIFDKDEEVIALIAMGYDVTESRNAQRELTFVNRQINMFFKMGVNGYFIETVLEPVDVDLLDDNKTAIEVLKSHRLLRYNEKAEEILGIKLDYDDPKSLFVNDRYKLDMDKIIRDFKNMIKDGVIDFVVEYDGNDDDKRYIEFSMKASIVENKYKGCYGVIKDITKDKKYQDKLFKMANYDTLTNVPNRRYLIHQANEFLKDGILTGCSAALCDIDFFKSVNDTYGHDVGDKVIIAVATTINDAIGNAGLFARVGGEEFFAVIYLKLADAENLIKNIINKIRHLRFYDVDKDFKVTISCGLTAIKSTDNFDTFYKRADNGLYMAKNGGRDKYVIIKE